MITLELTEEQFNTLLLVMDDVRPKDFNEYFPEGGTGWDGEGCQRVCELSNVIHNHNHKIKTKENSKDVS